MTTASVRAQLTKYPRLWGIDRATAYTIVAQAWSASTGVISIALIARFLSREEQGFYYSFFSVLGLQALFELGLGSVIAQCASHERAKLEWTPSGTLEGDLVSKSRLTSLLRTALVWYAAISILVMGAILPVGFVFFRQHTHDSMHVAWQYPWLWMVLVSACQLLLTPIFTVLEGSGLVAEMALRRLGQTVLGSLFFWSVLACHHGLYAIPAQSTILLCWSLAWIFICHRPFLADVRGLIGRGPGIDWRTEVWPFQWRLGVSWISGYLVFQLFTPVLFAYHGAVAAGKMGMSLSVVTTLSNLALAWMSTKAPRFGTLVARRQYTELDRLFFRSLRQSFTVAALAGVSFWSVAVYLHTIHHPFAQRLLDPIPLGLLVVSTLCVNIIGSEAIYLRAHKREPHMWLFLVSGCLVGVSNYVLGKRFGALGMMVGYLVINLIVQLGTETLLFARQRRLHQLETLS